LLKQIFKVSILIITKNSVTDWSHVYNLKNVEHKGIDFEIIVAEGNNPSLQRNKLAAEAIGDYILFLDDDSIPEIDLLEKYQLALVVFPDLEICGGPSVLINDHKFLTQLSIMFFSSSFGIGPVKNRYNPIGEIRSAGERDLILCNLMMRRDFFLMTNGFNQNLYPGEENEFIKKLKICTKIIYNPEVIVYRKPRESFWLFIDQMISYGRGRSKHFQFKRFSEYIFLVPMIFTLYVTSLPIIVKFSQLAWLPLSLYFLIAIFIISLEKNIKLAVLQKMALPLFFFCGHFSYGIGTLLGALRHRLFRKYIYENKKENQVKIYTLLNFKKNPT
jgi:cellulose synthase/poly-beta-1,6-N-acetylglucosamine synthase-like glycosyltransferase